MSKDKLVLCKFHWDCGRQGDLEGLFFSTESEIKGLVGKEIYFGEVLGKHSEIFGDIEEGDIRILNVDEATCKLLQTELGTTVSGYSPFDYVGDEEDEDDEE
jgi:hypothetical protein